jgi:hypothetical protein
MPLLTKTDFILYKECPNNVWVKKHKPEIYDKFEVSEFEKSLAEMGNEVEKLARKMFPDGYLIEELSKGASKLTKKLISENKPVIFQAVFATDKFFGASDVLKWNDKEKKYDIYEIKMSSAEQEETEDDGDEGKPRKINKKKEVQYEYDLAFQANIIEMSGVPLNKKYLVRLNKAYIKNGDLDFTPNKLFIIEDKTEVVDCLRPLALGEMDQAYEYVSSQNQPPGPCPCYYKGRNAHCTTFSYINPTVPAYSVHDINRIGNSKKYLKELLDAGIIKIDDVPEDERLFSRKPDKNGKVSKPKKLNQVRVYKSQKPLIDIEAIKKELNSFVYPLYFLDYETYTTAIPIYDGYHPYQHIVFQYSLHVLKDKSSKPFDLKCLVLNKEPSEDIVKSLRENIGNTGTIISWYKNFENSRNRDLAKLHPEYKDFLLGMVSRTYDLMDIVENQYYVHPEFHGKASIKKVLPVIAKIIGREEELSYKKLGVQNGTDAIDAYRQISSSELIGEAAKEKERQMLEYCKLDTYGMYVIWNHFLDLIS